MITPLDEIKNKLSSKGVDNLFRGIEVQIIEGTTDGAQTVAYKLEDGLTDSEEIMAKKSLLEVANESGIHAITAEF